MKCQEFENQIIDYFTGTGLPDEESEQVEQHAASCQTCWKEFNSYTELFEALQSPQGKALFANVPEPSRTEELMEYAQLLATAFLKKFYPSLTSKLEMTWKILADIDYKTLPKNQMTGALAAVGDTGSEERDVLSDVVICMSSAAKHVQAEEGETGKKEFKHAVQEAGKEMKIADTLLEQLEKFLNEEE